MSTFYSYFINSHYFTTIHHQKMENFSLDQIHSDCIFIMEVKNKSNALIASLPVEKQLRFYFSHYGWEVLEMLPSGNDKTLLYIKVEIIPGKECYYIPELASYRLRLIDVTGNIFCFSVNHKAAFYSLCTQQ